MTDMQVQEKVELIIEDTPVLVVTPPAVSKIKQLLAEKNIPDHALRVFVAGGGCSGLQYGMAFEGNVQEFDTSVEIDGVRMVIDPTSLLYVRGAVIDFVDSLMGGGFRIDNPNAVSTCGCGTSFRTKDHEASSEGGCSTCGH
ncbi:MAG: iron-sulfur cluster insertion protein ErpA [Chloroflexi bacterium]|nr:iron-sulfur cluster insertion protein ErpA [Chloroflexota bacterium]